MEPEDQWQMQQDLEEQEQKAIDCVVTVHKWGLEGTAKELAGLLGVTRQVQKYLEPTTTRTEHAQAL